ncbi:MAG: hypothetical protein ACOC6S_01810 [Chloroflexota bacterium]
MSGSCDIEIEFDDVSKNYYIVWQPPVAVGSGSSKIEALRDVLEGIHFCVDSLIEQKN